MQRLQARLAFYSRFCLFSSSFLVPGCSSCRVLTSLRTFSNQSLLNESASQQIRENYQRNADRLGELALQSHPPVHEAYKLFTQIQKVADISAWRNILCCYSKSPNYDMLLKLLQEYKRAGFQVEPIVYIYIFQCYANLPLAKPPLAPLSIFDDFKHRTLPQLLRQGDLDTIRDVFYSFMAMLVKFSHFNSLQSAYVVLKNERITPSIEIILLLIQGCSSEAALYTLNRELNFPALNNLAIYLAVMKFFGKHRNLRMVVLTAEACKNAGFPLPAEGYCVLLRTLASHGLVEKVYQHFDEMQESGVEPSLAMFREIMAGYAQAQNVAGLLHIYAQIKEFGLEPDAEVFVVLLDALADHGEPAQILNCFNELIHYKILPSEHHFCGLVVCFIRHGDESALSDIFSVMKDRRVKLTSAHVLRIASALLHSAQLQSLPQTTARSPHKLQPLSSAFVTAWLFQESPSSIQLPAAQALLSAMALEGQLDHVAEWGPRLLLAKSYGNRQIDIVLAGVVKALTEHLLPKPTEATLPTEERLVDRVFTPFEQNPLRKSTAHKFAKCAHLVEVLLRLRSELEGPGQDLQMALVRFGVVVGDSNFKRFTSSQGKR